MFYCTTGRLILPSLIQCILNSWVQHGLHHCDICMRYCSKVQCAAVSFRSGDAPGRPFPFRTAFDASSPLRSEDSGSCHILITAKVAVERHLSRRPLLRRLRRDLHSVLPGDGVAVLRIVEEGNVDSDQWRPISRQDLTSDYRHQAAWTNKQREGAVNKQRWVGCAYRRGTNTFRNRLFQQQQGGLIY